MIYVILYSSTVEPFGTATGLFYSASLNKGEAEKLYSQVILTEECFEKSLWAIDSKGVRTELESEHYNDELIGRNK